MWKDLNIYIPYLGAQDLFLRPGVARGVKSSPYNLNVLLQIIYSGIARSWVGGGGLNIIKEHIPGSLSQIYTLQDPARFPSPFSCIHKGLVTNYGDGGGGGYKTGGVDM